MVADPQQIHAMSKDQIPNQNGRVNEVGWFSYSKDHPNEQWKQNPSVIPLNPGWFRTGFPDWIIKIPNVERVV